MKMPKLGESARRFGNLKIMNFQTTKHYSQCTNKFPTKRRNILLQGRLIIFEIAASRENRAICQWNTQDGDAWDISFPLLWSAQISQVSVCLNESTFPRQRNTVAFTKNGLPPRVINTTTQSTNESCLGESTRIFTIPDWFTFIGRHKHTYMQVYAQRSNTPAVWTF